MEILQCDECNRFLNADVCDYNVCTLCYSLYCDVCNTTFCRECDLIHPAEDTSHLRPILSYNETWCWDCRHNLDQVILFKKKNGRYPTYRDFEPAGPLRTRRRIRNTKPRPADPSTCCDGPLYQSSTCNPREVCSVWECENTPNGTRMGGDCTLF